MKNHLQNTEISALCKSIAMMLSAGVTASEAVDILFEDCEDGLVKDSLKKLADDMTLTGSLGKAAQNTDIFPPYAAGIIDVGESSGRLEEVLESLSLYYERRETISARVKAALTYPILLLVLMCGVLLLLVTWVLPVFIRVYEDMAGTLSGSSYAYVSFAQTLALVCLLLVFVLCFALLLGAALYKTEKGKPFVLRFLEILPLSKGAMHAGAVSALCDTISVLLRSGFDEDTAMRKASSLVTHQTLSMQCNNVINELEGGTSLAKSFFDHKILSPVYGRILLSASRSGNLSEAMFSLAKTTGEEAQDATMRLIEAIEPLLTGFLTICVGTALLCVMLPLIGILGSL